MYIDLPTFEELERIEILWKVLPEKGGVYIIVKEDETPGYIGTTQNLRLRIISHLYKKNNPNCRYVRFYPEEDNSRRQMIEAVYKFKYLGSFKNEGYTFNCPMFDNPIVDIEVVRKELLKITF